LGAHEAELDGLKNWEASILIRRLLNQGEGSGFADETQQLSTAPGLDSAEHDFVKSEADETIESLSARVTSIEEKLQQIFIAISTRKCVVAAPSERGDNALLSKKFYYSRYAFYPQRSDEGILADLLNDRIPEGNLHDSASWRRICEVRARYLHKVPDELWCTLCVRRGRINPQNPDGL
jgi:hypothetical protein